MLRLLTIAVLGALFYITPASVLAESESSRTVEEVVVTARRREENVQTVPIPITAVTGESLRDRAAFDIRDLERVTPNLSYGNSAVSKNSAEVFLRGIGQVNWGPAQDPKVGTYLNGVYIGRPQGGIYDLLDVERIEVLRGPQGTLFGRNTTAGLIHIITKKPTDEFAARIKVGAGEDGQFLVAGTANIPLSDSLAARFAIQHREQDGFVHNMYDGSDWNDANSANARATFLWTPTDQFEAELGFDAQRVREKPTIASCSFLGPENGALAPGLEGIAWYFGAYDAVRDNCKSQGYLTGYEDDPDDSSEIDSIGVNLTMRWDLDIGELTSITSYRDMTERNGSWGFITDSIEGNVLEIQQPLGRDNSFDQWSQEIRLGGTAFDDQLDWVGGIYFFAENAHQLFDVPLFRNMAAPDCADAPQFCMDIGGGLTLGMIAQSVQAFASTTVDYDATNESQAIFAEGTYHFNDRLSVTAGIRYTEDDRELSLTQTLLVPYGGTDPAFICPDGSAPINNTCSRETGSQSEVTPRLILSYQMNDDIMLYGGWSKGYSSGGLNQTPRLEDYEPETSENWEVGFKSSLWDSRIRLNMTAFYNTYENQQQSVGRMIDNQPVVAILNAQEATLYGVETELTIVPADGWLITAAHGYTHGEYEEFGITDVEIGPPPQLVETVVVRDVSDTKVIRGPPYTYSVSVAKDFNFDNGSLTTQVGWSFRGRRYDDLDAPDHSFQKKYGLLDARATWRFPNDQTELSAWGTNLLDKKYTLSRGGGPDEVFQRIYWGPPSMVGLELTHAFTD
ncbi:MAG: TonB-dependent receptor [Vicinamibacterales bacterium]|jgi:iron complex outermembrane receptor protein|nr:TonB-dependent receptor [Vicinamibacterales bacterium]